MSELRFEKMRIPGGTLGKAGAYPIMYKQSMMEKESILSESEGLFINYGNITHMLPYTSLDEYDHSEEIKEFDVAVLENDYLKATFVPSLGGRMWSLYDKKKKRDLIINNPIFRPCNLSTRNAWFSGGVEWNCGVRGHSALTCDKIFAAKYQMEDGTPVLRMYAFERMRAITFQMDFFLKEDSPFLYARMRLVNGAKKVTPIYWWSTIAVQKMDGARVIVPANEAYVNQGNDPVYKISTPMVDGIDLSYPTNHKIAIDHFYKIPESSRKFEAYFDKDGKGLMHASTRRLKGRKLFVWGSSTGGENWQKFLTNKEGEKQPYLEIQAGLAATQNESLPMPPNTAWEWLEAYGAVEMDPKDVHGEWNTSRANVTSWLDDVLPEEKMDDLLSSTLKEATKQCDAVLLGHSWGELDNVLKQSMGEKEIAPYLDFGKMGKEQELWLRFLKNGYLDEPSPNEEPASYMVQEEWYKMLKDTVKGADKNNWYAWYHLGVCYFERELYDLSKEAFEKSLELQSSTWGYHGLANVDRVLGNEKASTLKMAKALSMNSDYLPLIKETMRFAYEGKEFDLMLNIHEELSEENKKDEAVQMYHAFALANTGEYQKAKDILSQNGGLLINDLREGDDSLVEEYIFIEQKIAEQNGQTLKAEDVVVPGKIDFRMFHESE